MSTCNYCRLKRLKKYAKDNNLKVTKRSSNFMGGVDFYIHPKEVKIPPGFKHTPDNKEGFDEYFTIWCKAVGKYCEC